MRAVRLIGLAGWSGAGKTTLMTRLIPELAARGLGVSTLKHAHHAFDVDRPGKDSYEHRRAGARQVLVASAHRWALMTEHRGAPEHVAKRAQQRVQRDVRWRHTRLSLVKGHHHFL
jgi:molybdopterin-guanine dinucleotide biosynthesis protein B